MVKKRPQSPSYDATCAMMLPNDIDEYVVIIFIHLHFLQIIQDFESIEKPIFQSATHPTLPFLHFSIALYFSSTAKHPMMGP